ncbi:hypothetical protein BLX24_09040 [Arsenicibacter rosenii]|uniref:Uncharacterized protein n=1 Tax=Arsenicibacter rosenii TaxID=1750698 RepID=A0A1S2VMH8_9BACT|nr:hypothetical protein BLX24_09040 [Arsenicibacter rosenii]
MADIEEATRKASEELQKNRRVVELHNKATDDTKGVVTQMRAQLSLLKTQWAGLSEEELRNLQVGGKLIKEIKALNGVLKAYEEEIGDTGRNVGNYEEAIRKALGEHEGFFNKVSSAIDVLKDFRDRWKEQAAGIKEYRANMLAQVSTIRETVKGMTATEAASFAAGKGTQFLGLALKGLGIGLIIAALAGLVAFFTKSQDGADYLARKTAALNAVFTVLLNRVVPIGKALTKAFTDPLGAATDLWNMLKDNVINRFTAFKVLAEGIINLDWGKMADGLIQGFTGSKGLATELKKASDAAQETTKKMQGLREEERAIEVQRAQNRAAIEKQKLIAEDTTRSLKEREAAAKKAFSIENDLLKKQTDVQGRILKNLQDEADRNKVNGERSVEYRDKIAEAEIKLAEIQEDSLGKQTELNNSLNSIRQEAADKAKEAADKIAEAEQKELDLLAKKLALRAEIVKLQGKDSTNLEVEAIRAAAKAEANQFKENQELKKLILEKGEAEVNKLIVEKEAERATLIEETRKAGIEAQLALVEKGTAKELYLLQLSIMAEADLKRIQAKEQITNKERLDAELRKIDAQTKRSLLDAEKSFYDDQAKMAEESKERQARMSKNLTDRMAQDLEQRDKNALDSIQTAILNAKEGSRKELDEKIALINKEEAIALAKAKSDEERARIRAEAERKREEERLNYQKKKSELIVGIVEATNNAISKMVEAQAQIQLANLDKQQQAALNSAGLNADMREKIEKDFAGKREKIEKDAAEKRKKIAIAESYIDEARAIINILTTSAKNPIMAAFLTAITHATAAQNRNIIRIQQFADGGFVSDGRGAMVRGAGTGKSDSIPARLSNGESVINANSTKMFLPLLSWVNELGGGKPFHHGPDLGAVARGLSTGGVISPGASTAQIDPALAELIETGMTRALDHQKPPVVDVQEVTNKQKKIQARESRHDL